MPPSIPFRNSTPKQESLRALPYYGGIGLLYGCRYDGESKTLSFIARNSIPKMAEIIVPLLEAKNAVTRDRMGRADIAASQDPYKEIKSSRRALNAEI